MGRHVRLQHHVLVRILELKHDIDYHSRREREARQALIDFLRQEKLTEIKIIGLAPTEKNGEAKGEKN